MVDKAKIIIADTRQLQGKEEVILPQIAPCYAMKYRSTKICRDARQELAAGYLLSKHLGVTRDEQLTYNACHKPRLASGTACFNLSHSGNLVVLAIAGCEVGVDIEKIMDVHEATVKKMFCEKQQEELLQLEGRAKNERFTELWTTYEAMLKLKGTGFEDSWDKIKAPVACHLHTTKIDDYFLSCATENQTHFEILFWHIDTWNNTMKSMKKQ